LKRRLFITNGKLPNKNPFLIGRTYAFFKDFDRLSTPPSESYKSSDIFGYSSEWVPYRTRIAKSNQFFHVTKDYGDFTMKGILCEPHDELIIPNVKNTLILSVDEAREHLRPYPCIGSKIRTVNK